MPLLYSIIYWDVLNKRVWDLCIYHLGRSTVAPWQTVHTLLSDVHKWTWGNAWTHRLSSSLFICFLPFQFLLHSFPFLFLSFYWLVKFLLSLFQYRTYAQIGIYFKSIVYMARMKERINAITMSFELFDDKCRSNRWTFRDKQNKCFICSAFFLFHIDLQSGKIIWNHRWF